MGKGNRIEKLSGFFFLRYEPKERLLISDGAKITVCDFFMKSDNWSHGLMEVEVASERDVIKQDFRFMLKDESFPDSFREETKESIEKASNNAGLTFSIDQLFLERKGFDFEENQPPIVIQSHKQITNKITYQDNTKVENNTYQAVPIDPQPKNQESIHTKCGNKEEVCPIAGKNEPAWDTISGSANKIFLACASKVYWRSGKKRLAFNAKKLIDWVIKTNQDVEEYSIKKSVGGKSYIIDNRNIRKDSLERTYKDLLQEIKEKTTTNHSFTQLATTASNRYFSAYYHPTSIEVRGATSNLY
jgi:hypothetical protein